MAFLPPDIRRKALRAARVRTPILIMGDTGTGKGHLAREIAGASRWSSLLEINCAALPDELLGSELFGHRRGAFTGALHDRKGLLVSARGKTLFLDEVGEVSPRMQRMLLKALERSRPRVKPLGADEEVPVADVRILYATNRDLRAEISAGRFREDLYRRIAVVLLSIPPLAARRDLLPAYLGRSLADLEESLGLRVASMSRAAYESLLARRWPGNVRELKNALEHALATAEETSAGVRIDVSDLPSEEEAADAAPDDLKAATKAHIKRVLMTSGGDASLAARRLGLPSRAALYYRLRKNG